jgi:hypothetical protein
MISALNWQPLQHRWLRTCLVTFYKITTKLKIHILTFSIIPTPEPENLNLIYAVTYQAKKTHINTPSAELSLNGTHYPRTYLKALLKIFFNSHQTQDFVNTTLFK